MYDRPIERTVGWRSALESDGRSAIGIPEEDIPECHTVVGRPAQAFPTELNQLAPEEMTYIHTCGKAISVES
jgi:hypothetical protein